MSDLHVLPEITVVVVPESIVVLLLHNIYLSLNWTVIMCIGNDRLKVEFM